MKTVVMTALVLASLHGVLGDRATPDEVIVRNQIVRQYGRIRQAFRAKDVSILQSILAPGFTLHHKESGKPGDKPVDRDRMLAGWRAWFSVLKSVTSQTHTIRSVKIDGDHAVTEVEWAITFTEDHGAEGLRHASIRGPSRDTWVRTAEGWKLLRMESTGPDTVSAHMEQRK